MPRLALATLGVTWSAFALLASAVARTFAGAVFPRLFAVGGGFGADRKVTLGTRDRLPNQAFDRSDRLGIERGDDRDRGAGAAGASGTADTMHVIVGMMRDVEIEDVAHDRNVEAPGR